MAPDASVCLRNCPTGFSKEGTDCVGTATSVVDLTFRTTATTLSANGVTVSPADTTTAPIPLYRRGLQFDGSRYLNIEGLQLPSTFTISAWVRITGNSNIFSISRTGGDIDTEKEEDLLNFGDTEDKLYFSYAEGSNVHINLTTAESAYTFNDWYLVAVCVEWNDSLKQSTVSLFSNGDEKASGTFNVPVLDSPAYRHLLGAEMNYVGGQQ